jgi:LysM repeat protein
MITLTHTDRNEPVVVTGCPHLGIRNDVETRYGSPVLENLCHYVDPATGVNLGYQSSFCLSSGYQKCSVYLGENQNGLPDNIRGKSASKPGWSKPWFWIVLTVCIAVVIFALQTWRDWAGSSQPGDIGSQEISQATVNSLTLMAQQTLVDDAVKMTVSLTVVPSPTDVQLSPTYTPDPPTDTPILTATSTPPPSPGPNLETPFGADQIYLIHQINTGESLPMLAILYDTSVEVIREANSLVPDYSVQPGQTIVILPGHTDPVDIEPLEVIYLEDDDFISEIVLEYGITIDEMKQHNDLGPGVIIPGGRWLVFPRRRVDDTPTPTLVITSDLSTALTEPFGPNNEYILHQVKSGESMGVLEDLYLTSADVIRQANTIDGSIRVDQVLVIILNLTDPSGVQLLRVLYVEEEISVEDLALQLEVLASDLIYYNGLADVDLIPPDRWIIYPAISGQ